MDLPPGAIRADYFPLPVFNEPRCVGKGGAVELEGRQFRTRNLAPRKVDFCYCNLLRGLIIFLRCDGPSYPSAWALYV
jgi:hypothetical protein